jgi:hypothetical protein
VIIFRQHRIYREDLQANPDILYIFGDNLDREGLGGQAGEMRGEPNAFGIATKRAISHGYPQDYFFDGEEDVKEIINGEFDRLLKTIRTDYQYENGGGRECHYRLICIPLDGIGTGLSRLPETAPKLLEYINQKLKELEKL